MKALAKSFIALAAMFSTVAIATSQEIGFQIHGLSHHFESRPSVANVPWTEVNYGFGLSVRDRDVRYLVGSYKNSLSSNKGTFYSRYAIVDYQPIVLFSSNSVKMSLGGFVGVVSGYPSIEWNKDGSMGRVHKHGPRPALGVSTRTEYENFNVTFRLVPTLPNASSDGSAVLTMETGYTF